MSEPKHDLLDVLIPIVAALLRAAPHLVDDARKLRDALRTHPNVAIQPGADKIDDALKAATYQ